MTFPKLSLCFWSPREFKFFSTQNPRVKIIWLLPFILNDKGLWKDFEFHPRNIFNSETLSNSMIFPREDKMTSSNYRKYELEVFWNFLELNFKYWVIWFYSKYFSPKINYMENRVTWFPTAENSREINLKSFWYFRMIYYWILLQQ